MITFQCEYSSIPLPLSVVDDYIYENPPTLLLGTVDKFAMVTWKAEAGKLFGFRESENGWKRITPPELIIQDELHLIAGPLGTMVGLYETMVQTLCNNYNRTEPPFLPDEEVKFTAPKIIASSATISRAYEQVKSLYGITEKEKLHIFPSQGLEFGNTWFSKERSIYEKDEQGNQQISRQAIRWNTSFGIPFCTNFDCKGIFHRFTKDKGVGQSSWNRLLLDIAWLF